MPMRDFAEHIIAVANENNLPITNLKLQKVMYFTLQRALQGRLFNAQQIANLYDEPFMVWRYGPVVEEVYDEYRIFGADTIVEDYTPNPQYDNLNLDILDLLNQNTFSLVNKSHQEEHWRRFSSQINGWRSDVPYTLDDIRNG